MAPALSTSSPTVNDHPEPGDSVLPEPAGREEHRRQDALGVAGTPPGDVGLRLAGGEERRHRVQVGAVPKTGRTIARARDQVRPARGNLIELDVESDGLEICTDTLGDGVFIAGHRRDIHDLPEIAEEIVHENQASSGCRKSRETFVPPNPKELESTLLTVADRAVLGTLSRSQSGSGVS